MSVLFILMFVAVLPNSCWSSLYRTPRFLWGTDWKSLTPKTLAYLCFQPLTAPYVASFS